MYKLPLATRFCQDCPQHFPGDSIKNLSEVYKYSIQVLLLIRTFFLNLSDCKDLVHFAPTRSKSTLCFKKFCHKDTDYESVQEDVGNNLPSSKQEMYPSVVATVSFGAHVLVDGDYRGITEVVWQVFIFPDACYDVMKGLTFCWSCCLVDFSWNLILHWSLSCTHLVDGLPDGRRKIKDL